jgi:hypothetical protein
MKSEVEAIFLFVAELTGSFKPGTGNKADKINCGKSDYINSSLHKLDLNKEKHRKELHENVWLERLYNELDAYFNIHKGNRQMKVLSLDVEAYREETYQWSLPIELDASASMLQYMAVLLNDKRLMEMTNIIGTTLNDPWKLEGMGREMLKEAATPMLYGSSKTCTDLWTTAKIKYTAKDVQLYNKEMSTGPFGLVNMFKDFLINNCNPSVSMKVNINQEKFYISCNRYRNVGEKTKAYKIWDSIDKLYNTVLHTDTKKIPDLEQFRRFFPTLLIHNLDSQTMDNVIGKVISKYKWGIPIHDAAIVSPAAAYDTRQWYGEEIDNIHANRKTILKNFFKSIGITAAGNEQWAAIMAKVVPFEGTLNTSSMALK